MAHKPRRVREDWLLNPRADGRDLRLDTPAWLAWLEASETRSVAYGLVDPRQGWIAGFLTVRKDRRERGGWYWSVFRRQGSQMRRFYLGRAEQVTAARLAGIAQQLLAEAGDPQ